METTLNFTPAQAKAKRQLAANADFDSYGTEYDMGSGWIVVEWYDYQYRVYATEIRPDGTTSTREIWTD